MASESSVTTSQSTFSTYQRMFLTSLATVGRRVRTSLVCQRIPTCSRIVARLRAASRGVMLQRSRCSSSWAMR